MYYQVTMYFQGSATQVLRVRADTGAGAMIAALSQDWTMAQRAALLNVRADKETTP